MPYGNNSQLPASVRGALPSETAKTMFRRVVNSQLRNGKSESVAFASAWAALQNAGYEKKDGKWVKKEMPSAGSVHVPSTRWKKPKPLNKAHKSFPEALSKAYGAEPVYGFRPVLNAEEICQWAKSQGFTECMVPDELHVTTLHSKRGFAPYLTDRAKEGWDDRDHYGNIVVRGGERAVMPLGDNGAVTLKIDSEELYEEWKSYMRYGAAWDYPEYMPHVTLSYRGAPEDLSKVVPYDGDVVLGPTRYRPMREGDFDPSTVEHMDLRDGFLKYQMHRDAFTMPDEAATRSIDMGLGGEYHVYELDGQGVYMPGRDHDTYLAAIGYEKEEDDEDEMEDDDESEDSRMSMLRLIIETIIGKRKKEPVAKAMPATILKVDDEKRIVWGWASVTTVKGEPVVDLHGDVIKTETMVEAADKFMLYRRTAKAMHDGKQIGIVLHSFPFTKELGEALGVTSDREGWIIAMKILDEDHWSRVKSGEFRGFSIGGKGKRVQID